MPTIRFAVSEEYSRRLDREAERLGCSVQDYIRIKLFDEPSIYTASEAVRRALEKYKKDETFSLPDLYENWDLQRGAAGAFGKQFFAYVENNCSDKIRFNGMTDCNRRAQYIIKQEV